MGFNAVEIAAPAPQAVESVRIGMRGKKRLSTVTLTRAVAAALGWSDGTRVKMLVGSGEDYGRVQFVPAGPDDKGTATVAKRKAPLGSHYFVLRLGFLAFTPKGADEMPTEGCAFDVLGGTTLEIELPHSWRSATPEVRTGLGAGTTVALNGKKAIIDAARQKVPATITRV